MTSICVFRADANAEIGSGHFIRSLSLAAEWVKRGHEAVMIGSAPDELVQRVQGFGVGYRQLSNSNSLEDDSVALIEACTELKAQIVCIDGYQFDPDYVGRVRESGVSVIEFSDGPIWSEYQSDLLLDQNLGAQDQAYKLTSQTRALLGLNYVCLAPQFLNLSDAERSATGQTLTLLVSMGGADPKDATTAVLNAVFSLDASINVTVTVGVSNPKRDELQELVDRHSNGRVLVDAQNMAELMSASDIAIVAAGSTSWELAYMGVPALLSTVADNQIRIAEQLAKSGAAINLGRVENLSSKVLLEQLIRLIENSDIRASMSRTGQELIDGKGASRVVAEMLSLIQ